MIIKALGQRTYKTVYRSEDMNVLVSGDQMGALGDARSCLKLVSCQHPDLSRGKRSKLL